MLPETGDGKRDRQEDKTEMGREAIYRPRRGESGKSHGCNYHHIVLNKNLVHNYSSLRYMSVILGL